MNVFITGATGFVGKHLVSNLLLNTSYDLCLSSRGVNAFRHHKVNNIQVVDSFSEMDWEGAFKECSVVIHLAARVHVMKENSFAPLEAYREMNVKGTLNLARQAASRGVKRFIFLSTIKVNGEETSLGRLYTPEDYVSPQDPYAISKFEAEQGLFKLGKETGMVIVVIRAPLIYGPGVKGNFLRMIKWVKRGIPLPFGHINNKRSYVSIYNLIELIRVCITHSNAANQVFLVSDDKDLSTPELLEKISKSMNKKLYLLPVPKKMILFLAGLLGEHASVQRLFGSLQVDINKTKKLLGWNPVPHTDEVLDLINLTKPFQQ